MTNLAALCVETIQVDGATQLSQFAVVVLDAQGLYEVESFSTHVKTSSGPMNYPQFQQVADKIRLSLAGRIWIGYNLKASTDLLGLGFADAKLSAPVAASSLDLSTASSLSWFPAGLNNLTQHFGLPRNRASLLDECRQMVELLKNCALSLFLTANLPKAASVAPVSVPEKTETPVVVQEVKAPAPTPEPVAPVNVEPVKEVPKPAAPTHKTWASLSPRSPVVTAAPSPVVDVAPLPPAAAPQASEPAAAPKPAKLEKPVMNPLVNDPNVKPLSTPWADLIAPTRPKTELSYEKVEDNKKNNFRKKNNNQRKKKDVDAGADSKDGEQKRQNKPQRRNPEGKADGAEGGERKPREFKARKEGEPRPKGQPRRPRTADDSKSKNGAEGAQDDEGWNPVVKKVPKPKEAKTRAPRSEGTSEGSEGEKAGKFKRFPGKQGTAASATATA